MNTVRRLFRHLWLDQTDALRIVGEGGLARLEALIGASEQAHSGEICLCIEASLPPAMLWRHVAQRAPIDMLVRQRALDLFSAMRVWDTEANNGVLIYLQLAEHRIEIVADRGLAGRTASGHWEVVLAECCSDFRKRGYERGLARAIEAVSAALVTHFPAAAQDSASTASPPNQLPDRPVVR